MCWHSASSWKKFIVETSARLLACHALHDVSDWSRRIGRSVSGCAGAPAHASGLEGWRHVTGEASYPHSTKCTKDAAATGIGSVEQYGTGGGAARLLCQEQLNKGI